MTTALALTRNQTLVLHALAEAKTPLSAYTILERLHGAGLKGPPQIYRALKKLLDCGLIHRLESLNAFVACSHGQCSRERTVAFAICDDCGCVSEFSDGAVEEWLCAWSKGNGFRLARTTIEIHGSCADCLAA